MSINDITPHPATTDDTVERAARAAAEHIGWQPGIYEATRAALAAAGAGEAVDREAAGSMAERLAVERRAWRALPDSSAEQKRQGWVMGFLAARGDVATPTVTAEQAAQMAVHIADWLSDTGVSDAHREAVTDALRQAGIEVTDRA